MISFQNLDHIPHQAGVYFFKNKKWEILYIGKAKNLHKRVSQYFATGSLWKQDMFAKAEHVEFVVVQNESEAIFLEDNLIKKYKPQYNNLLKGDNSYTYIKITNEDFPQIFLTRYKQPDGAIYIGPKYLKHELKKLLQFLRQLFQRRGCKTMQFREGKLCSDYLFGLCKGRCVFAKLKQKNIDKYISEAWKLWLNVNKKFDFYKKKSDDVIGLVTGFFSGDIEPIQEYIKQEITHCIEQQNFEWAAKLRDIFQHLQLFVEKQSVVLSVPLTGRFFYVATVAESYVLVMLNFFQGKLIDIIRTKQTQEETDIDTLKSSFEQEFGGLAIHHETERVWMIQEGMEIGEELLSQILELCVGFVDSYILGSSYEQDSLMQSLLEDLEQTYHFKKFPYTIECMDISHLSGWWISGGLSQMQGGILNKKGYRRYKIQALGENKANLSDDYASLREVLLKRAHDPVTHPLPDVMMIDGGKWQLNVVKKLKQEDPDFAKKVEWVEFVSLGKGEARERSWKNAGEKEILYRFDEETIVGIDLTYGQADKLLTHLRDEAHRFANAYRKKQMQKEWK